jgi:murein DD-endopeptidase MepM/ murein hydrolase activator NlpD
VDIILISEKKNKTINLHLKLWLVIIAAAVFIAIVVSFIYGITTFATEEVDQQKLLRLQEENEVVQQELIRINDEVRGLQSLIDSIAFYNSKLHTYGLLSPLNIETQDSNRVSDSSTIRRSIISTRTLADLAPILDTLAARARIQKERYDQLLAQLDEQRNLQNHIPSIIPVQGWIIRRFGNQIDPFTGTIKMHEAIDIAAPQGTPIIAPADGRVTFVGTKKGYGLTIEIDHGYDLMTRYAHCQRSKVARGRRVKRGDIIAYVGNTGTSIGPHLHYEVRVSKEPMNPLNYILTTATSNK